MAAAVRFGLPLKGEPVNSVESDEGINLQGDGVEYTVEG